MNGLKRYAPIIDNKRNLSQNSITNSLKDIYKNRVELLQSDLPTIYNLIETASEEYKKGDEADIEKVIEISEKCVKKLKKFVKKMRNQHKALLKNVGETKANN